MDKIEHLEKIYFISDIHLSEHEPEITALFEDFIHRITPQATALYILGDLFDNWIGDDDDTPYNQRIVNILRYASKHTSVYFIHGNRDFLLGTRFFNATGIIPLPSITTHVLFNQKITLTHGDLLCTEDQAYQRMRRVFHCQPIQKLFLHLPLSIRRAIASKARAISQSSNQTKPQKNFTINHAYIQEILEKEQSKCMIYGHIHSLNITNYSALNAKSISLKDCTHKQLLSLSFNLRHIFSVDISSFLPPQR